MAKMTAMSGPYTSPCLQCGAMTKNFCDGCSNFLCHRHDRDHIASCEATPTCLFNNHRAPYAEREKTATHFVTVKGVPTIPACTKCAMVFLNSPADAHVVAFDALKELGEPSAEVREAARILGMDIH